MTRLVGIIFIILLLFDFKYSVHFLAISVIVLIILYYIQKKTMEHQNRYQAENYKQPIIEYYKPAKQPTKSLYQPARPVPGEPYDMSKLAVTKKKVINGVTYDESYIETPEELYFCNDFQDNIDGNNQNIVGLNQRLTIGPQGQTQNRNTYIKPVVVPPTYDLEYWKDNNLITYSQINSTGVQEDMYLSGYAESSCCGYLDSGSKLVPSGANSKENYSKSMLQMPRGVQTPKDTKASRGAQAPRDARASIKEGFAQECSGTQWRTGVPKNNSTSMRTCQGRQIVSPVLVEDRIPIKSMPVREGFAQECSGTQWRTGVPKNNGTCQGRQIVSPVLVEDRIPIKSMPVREGYTQREDYSTGEELPEYMPSQLMPEQPGMMNTACGYNPEQLEVNLPSNMPVGNCQKSPALAGFNKNIFTQIVTPGVYTMNQINEPINSNIGISFQQQFEPVTCDIDENQNVHYLEHDPRVVQPTSDDVVEEMENPRYDNVYDPRFYGYGTSYRSYNEPTLGQTRFMYDDINAIRMPNYVVRSKIDHLPFADTYGPVEEGSEMGNVHNPHMRALVQDSWLRNSLQFRNDLTERRMRKINANQWQKRIAPLGAKMI